jgi:hypothetical protein
MIDQPMTDAAALKIIVHAAGAIVLEVSPRARKADRGNAYVRRSLIANLEEALTQAGFDMEAARKHYRTLQQEIDARVAERINP